MVEGNSKNWRFLFSGFLVALIASLGALFIGEVMGQTPCVLCWYQRIFMFPLAIILALAVYFSDLKIARYALALALPGLLVAVYHSLLYAGVIPTPIVPCSSDGPSCTDAAMKVLGVPLPYVSVIAFTIIIDLVVRSSKKECK